MKLYLPYLQELVPNLVILGLNSRWEGFITKYKLLLEYLSSANIPDDALICFIDAYDVLPTKQLAKLETTYRNFIKVNPGVKMIVGYDKVDNIIHEYLCQVIFGTIDDARLNSGQFIGTAKHIREIVSHIVETTSHFQTDQIELTKYANQFKSEIYIDVNQEFFYVKSRPLQQVLLPKSAAGPSAAGPSAAGPAFIHANGNGFLNQFLAEEHAIQVGLSERWTNIYENVKGVMRKIIIYDLIYIKKYIALLYNFLRTFFDKNIKRYGLLK
jgi:hypothetical protein